MKRFSLLILLHTVLLANGFSDNDSKDPDAPLILSAYIESEKLEEARNLSRVELPGFPEIKSYAGFFTVNQTFNSNLFLWYFPAKSYIKEQAVILWLQGGPGASSLYGLFAEHGPLEVRNNTFHKRNIHWSKHHHLIYIDSPVGTGFSFTNDSRSYCTDLPQIGEHLYSTLIQFFQIFPELQQFPFLISGESYGGKYVPVLGYTIHKNNPSAKMKINLKGLMIGDGWSDPINQLNYSDYLYQIGLIDWNQQKEIEDQQNKVIELTKKEAWLDAGNELLDLYYQINNFTGNISLLSYLPSKSEIDYFYEDLIQNVTIRRAIHVGNLTYSNHSVTTVFDSMSADLMKSAAPWISELLEHYHILFYNGQLDINVAYPLTVNFLKKLNFSVSEEYLKAKRKILCNVAKDNSIEVAGFLKNAGKLTEVMIRNAGHLVPSDQPEWIYNLIIWWRLNIVAGEALDDNINEIKMDASHYNEQNNDL